MAETTGALPTNQTGNLAANISALLQTFGGTKTTTATNPGETDALRATLAQLQGADYNAMLQSIFQQAGGQIPGLQTALGNAIGARSGGNSAVAAALQKLLQQTTVAAQDQMAKQQLANQQTQVQAGGAIAQATKGTQTTEQKGTNVKQGATDLAKATALTQLLGSALKLTGKGTLQDAFKGLLGTTASAPAPAGTVGSTYNDMYKPSAATVTSAAAPQMSMAPSMSQARVGGIDLGQLLSSTAPAMSTPVTGAATAPDMTSNTPAMSTAPSDMFTPALDINTILGTEPTPAPEMSSAPAEWFAPRFDINDYLD